MKNKRIISIIKNNLENVYKKIQDTALRHGRDPKEIKLVVVTKTVDVDIIKLLPELGVSSIGENRLQDALRKFNEINTSLSWHMVGHLQRNKVKKAIELFDMIHSVDSLRLAEEINKRSSDMNSPKSVLIQVNTSQEATKFGLKEKEIPPFLEKAKGLKFLKIEGLMTMAPYIEPERCRKFFIRLKNLRDEMSKNFPDIDLGYLSMGMSNDFEVAIEEGANILRIGSRIFEGI